MRIASATLTPSPVASSMRMAENMLWKLAWVPHLKCSTSLWILAGKYCILACSFYSFTGDSIPVVNSGYSSTKCPTDQCPFNLFNSSISSTFKDLNTSFSIEYGLGSANGSYATDTVTVGTTVVPNQYIGLAATTQNLLDPSTVNDIPSDGILGIGYPGLNSVRGIQNDTPLAFNLMQSKIIAQPIFSIFLNSSSAFGESGEITFGGIDDTKHNGQIQYVPVVSYTVVNGSSTQANIGPQLGNKTDGTYLFWAVPGQGVSTIISIDRFRPLKYIFSTLVQLSPLCRVTWPTRL